MPVQTTWTVNQMVHKVADGGVFEVNWSCTAQNDAGLERAVSGDTYGFEYDASAPDYTPYDDLTETQVIGWVKDKMTADSQEEGSITPTPAELETQLVEKVDAQIARNNADATGMPWAAE